MRVLVVSNLYPPYWVGGYEQIAGWVVSGLRERGHDVQVLTGRGRAFDGRPDVHGRMDLDLDAFVERYFADGLGARDSVRSQVRRHVFSLENLRVARETIRAFRPHVVSFWNSAYVSFSPLLAARMAGVAAVAHLSDTVANPFRNPHPPRFPERLRPAGRMGVDLLLRLASPRLFVVPSAFLREKLTVREGLVPGRVRVLPWPVEPTICRGAPPAPRPDPRRRLLFVGTLIPEKGAHVLVEAFRLAHGECPSLALTLVGEGPASFVRTLEETARGLPVAFRGRLDRPGVTAEYAGHDVLVFPSVWEEPYAVVPTEGMAMGLALVATRTGGTPEAVRHGATGLLVPPGDARALADAVLRLARDGELASRLAREGQRWALEERGFDPFMTALEALYAEGAGARRMAA